MMVTVEQIVKKFQENGFKETEVTCPDDTVVTIIPCSYVEPTDISQCDWFLVEGDMPWMGDASLEKIVDELNRHGEVLEAHNKEKERCKAYFDKHQAEGWDDDSWSWYSDWHKDLFGYRPHGYVFGEYVNPYSMLY